MRVHCRETIITFEQQAEVDLTALRLHAFVVSLSGVVPATGIVSLIVYVDLLSLGQLEILMQKTNRARHFRICGLIFEFQYLLRAVWSNCGINHGKVLSKGFSWLLAKALLLFCPQKLVWRIESRLLLLLLHEYLSNIRERG
jgi:hypothetical protein